MTDPTKTFAFSQASGTSDWEGSAAEPGAGSDEENQRRQAGGAEEVGDVGRRAGPLPTRHPGPWEDSLPEM